MMNCQPFIACIAGCDVHAGSPDSCVSTPPGSIATEPSGINDRGQIVGGSLTSDGSTHGFLDARGTFTTIDAPGAVSEGRLNG